MPPRRNPKVDSALAIKAESSREGAAAFASPTASTPHTRRSSRTVDHDSISPLTPPSSIEDDEAGISGKLGEDSARKRIDDSASPDEKWPPQVDVVIPKSEVVSAAPTESSRANTSAASSQRPRRGVAPSNFKREASSSDDIEFVSASMSKGQEKKASRKRGRQQPSSSGELSDVPLASVSRSKGKAKALPEPSVSETFKIADDLRNYDMTSGEESEGAIDSSRTSRRAPTRRGRNVRGRKADTATPEIPDEQEMVTEDEADSEEWLSEVSDSPAPPPKRQRGRGAARRRTAAKAGSSGSDDDSLSDADPAGDDENGTGASGSAEAGARGFYAEDIQYETAKQRKARLRSERHQQRLKKKATQTQYQKTVSQLSENHSELVGVWQRLAEEKSNNKKVAAPQPDGLNINLLPFQLEGVNWLVQQEKGSWKGGILADEMGMGKTIQMISLFLADRKKPTLVVAPVVAILQWRNEIAKYTKDFKVLVWHGASRDTDAKKLGSWDIVLTSYSVMESAYRKQENGFRRKGEIIKEKSALHAVNWHRVVLDEAHNIKERATNTAKAAFELKSEYRWCLSGTPLMNRVGELYSMIRFLHGDPFGFYYCKRCPCKSLHWQFSDRRSCDKCGHTPMHHVCFWNISVLRPIQREGTVKGEGGDAFKRLRILLDKLMLRRTKLERADDMGLPPRTIVVRKDYFNEEEEDLYDSLYRDGARKFSTYLDQGTILNNYSNIFTLLTRMRQIACHPDLVLRSKTGIQSRLLGQATDESIHLCRICAEEATDAIASKCRHVFCRECVRQYLDSAVEDTSPDCPHCHAQLSIDLEQDTLDTTRPEETRQGILAKIDVDKWRSSTKIEALVEELNEVRSEDSTTKSIVFSQFVNFLDLIAFRLQRAGFKICRLEGSMTPEARDRTVRYFMETPDVTVFLVSLKAGGVALNLTEASRVYLMDPWWAGAVATQASDRIHRLGQYRPIKITHLIIENSIESRIMELVNKKHSMVNATLDSDDGAMGRLSVTDLKFLFVM